MSRSVEDALLKQLKNPFDPKFIKWRVGATNKEKTKAIALAYIDSREVKKRLDEVMGVGGWKDELVEVKDGFVDTIYLKINDEWIGRAGAGENTKMSPIKGGASDAFKRAAAKWGIGHYLYYLPNVWVPINEYKQLKEIPELPDWATPGRVENWEDVAEMESTAESGADDDGVDLTESIITGIDLIRAAKNLKEFDESVLQLSEDQKLLLANEINTKKRQLTHEAKINADNS